MLAVISNSQSKILQELNTQLPKLYLPGSCPISQTHNLWEHQGLILLCPSNWIKSHPHVHVQDLSPSNWDVHLIEFKYCDDTRPESQLQKAGEHHRRLLSILKAQGCSKVSLHVILMGVMGTIYRSHTDTPLSKLGLSFCKAKKLTKDLNTHYIKCNTNYKTKRKLGFHQQNANGTGGVSSRTWPTLISSHNLSNGGWPTTHECPCLSVCLHRLLLLLNSH